MNVSIEGTVKGAVAGRNGNYEIKNVAPGNYVLIASFVGLENRREQIAVSAGQTAIVDFVLNMYNRERISLNANLKRSPLSEDADQKDGEFAGIQ